MKNYMMIALLTATGGAHGSDVSIEEVCGNASEVAEAAAELRYDGVPMRTTMAAIAGNEFVQAIVQDAYALPDYSTESHQRSAALEFGNEVYGYCYKHFSEQQ